MGHLCHLGLGSGCSAPFGSPVGFVWRSVFWYHYSAGGDSVAPDLVPSSDVCLGGSRYDVKKFVITSKIRHDVRHIIIIIIIYSSNNIIHVHI